MFKIHFQNEIIELDWVQSGGMTSVLLHTVVHTHWPAECGRVKFLNSYSYDPYKVNYSKKWESRGAVLGNFLDPIDDSLAKKGKIKTKATFKYQIKSI